MKSKKMKEFKKRMAENRDKMEAYMSQQTEKENYNFKRCRAFFDKLADILKEKYVVVNSCNKDLSAYLVPIGTEDQITYYGKPLFSFRVSDHWNWYSSGLKCSDLSYIQCFSSGVQYPLPRDPNYPDKPTKARHACQVAYVGKDGAYHPVYGEVWFKGRYNWKSVHSPEEVANFILRMNMI